MSSPPLTQSELDDMRGLAENGQRYVTVERDGLHRLLAENQRLEDKCVSLTLEVEAEKHNHRKDNEYLLAENQRLQDESDYLRVRMSVAVSFLPSDLLDTFHEHVAELDTNQRHRREALAGDVE